MSPREEKALRRRAVQIAKPLFFVAWGAACVAIGAVLMVGHWVPLPVPENDDPVLTEALQELAPAEQRRWGLVHVLYAQCRCSQRTFEYLFERGAVSDAQETVVLVGKHEEYAARARESGFAVESIARKELKQRFNVETAPLLLVTDPDGSVQYSGGYTARKQGLDYRDLEILSSLRNGGDRDAIPAYGCGVSRELQSYLDPIGVKYGSDEEGN